MVIVGTSRGTIRFERRRTERHDAWRLVSTGNERHALFTWISLVFVALTDIYARLVLSRVILDPRWVA